VERALYLHSPVREESTAGPAVEDPELVRHWGMRMSGLVLELVLVVMKHGKECG
jgi:hypothetical protein